MSIPPGIYRVDGTDEYVVAAEAGGMFMTSETLDSEDIEELISGQMDLTDYALSSERARPVSKFTLIPYEKWIEIPGVEIHPAIDQEVKPVS